jgi:hypothetical protein
MNARTKILAFFISDKTMTIETYGKLSCEHYLNK